MFEARSAESTTPHEGILKYMTHLIMVLHQLDDHPDVVAVVLDGDDPHDVGGVLCVRVGAVFVGQHQARVSLMHLEHRNMQILIPVPVYTFALSRSTAFISDPWKYFILVCCLFSSPSSSKSGSALGQEKSYVIPLMQKCCSVTCAGRPPPHPHPLCPRGGSPWGSVRPTRRWCGRTQQHVWMRWNRQLYKI